MALVFLLFVFLIVIAAIAFFVFPTDKWAQMFTGEKKKE